MKVILDFFIKVFTRIKVFLKGKRMSRCLSLIRRYWFYAALGLAALWGAYLVIYFSFSYQWSEERKQEYLQSKSKDMKSGKDSLIEVVRRIQKHRANFDKDLSGVKDIFK